MANYFKNRRLAKTELGRWTRLQHPLPQTIKTFSRTRWNGASVMFRSVLENRSCIRALFAEWIWKEPSDALRNIHDSSSTAKTVLDTAQKSHFWSGLTSIAPFLNFICSVVTFMEFDTCPLSLVTLAFWFLYEVAQAMCEEHEATVIFPHY